MQPKETECVVHNSGCRDGAKIEYGVHDTRS